MYQQGIPQQGGAPGTQPTNPWEQYAAAYGGAYPGYGGAVPGVSTS